MDKIVSFESVSKVYRRGFKGTMVNAVTDFSASVTAEKITGFVGPNGAGKTTSIKMLMGLVKPTSGAVTIRGIDSSSPRARQDVSYVSEQPYFYRHLSVKEALRFSCDLLKFDKAKTRNEIERVLEIVALTGKENTRIHSMSKGMMQRLNMANGLLGDPHLLLLDEPMSGLDPPARRLFRNLFIRLGKEGKTIFFSTHVLEDIEMVCDEVIVMNQGRLRYCGEVSVLLEKGYLGTELITPTIPPEVVEKLTARGWTVSHNQDHTCRVFVPQGDDATECQRTLAQHAVFSISITRRTMPLETLLYGSSTETSS